MDDTMCMMKCYTAHNYTVSMSLSFYHKRVPKHEQYGTEANGLLQLSTERKTSN